MLVVAGVPVWCMVLGVARRAQTGRCYLRMVMLVRIGHISLSRVPMLTMSMSRWGRGGVLHVPPTNDGCY